MFCPRCLVALMLAVLVLAGMGGCAADTSGDEVTLTDETAVYEGAGYRLTYPACFSLIQQTDKMVNFSVEGGNMAFTLTQEENPYGLRDIEEYPDLMGIYNGVTIGSDTSFSVEKYQPDILSAYYLYTFSEDSLYLLEYNFGGTAEQRAMEPLFSVEIL